MATVPTRPHLRRVLLVAGIAAALLTLTVPASADPLPLSDPPTASLTCVDGASYFTMHWPAGEYGVWNVGDDALGAFGGPGGVFTAPFDETFVVPPGWQAQHSTARLNLDTVGGAPYNQVHIAVDGTSCPFDTPVQAAIACSDRSLTLDVPAGAVSALDVYDQDGTLLYSTNYPIYDINGVIEQDVPVGPVTVTIPDPAPTTATSIRVVVIVSNATISSTIDTRCLPAPLPGVAASATDGSVAELEACDGTVTATRRPGSLTIFRTGATADPLVVSLSYAGTLAADLSSTLPSTVTIPAGQDHVDVPVSSGAPGTLQVSIQAGAGYVVSAQGHASVAITRTRAVAHCGGDGSGEPQGQPTDPGGKVPVTTTTTVVPARPVDPWAAPPAEVITGYAHLTG